MNTKINLTYDGQDYTLEFDRMSIKMLENIGFDYDKFMEKPMTNVELAFTGAFVKNHPKVKQEVIEAIYEACPKKDELIGTLSLMINECYESLLSEGDSGKVTWETVDLTPKKTEKSQG
jgi:hypothetical protein